MIRVFKILKIIFNTNFKTEVERIEKDDDVFHSNTKDLIYIRCDTVEKIDLPTIIGDNLYVSWDLLDQINVREIDGTN